MTTPMYAAQIDDHTHTTAGSSDALSSMAELCARAVELGLRSLCFTEHVDYDTTLSEYGYFNFDRIRREFAAAQAAYAGRLELRLGLEVDFRPSFRSRMLDDLPHYPVDFVLGSVHSYRDCHLLEVRRTRPVWTLDELGALYAGYFSDLRLLIETGMVDSLAHFDYPSKLGMRPDDPAGIPGYDDELEATLALAVARGVGIEVNTKRADRDAPLAASEAMLRRYRALGGTRVTLGSDAHRVKDLGAALSIGVAAMCAAGIPYLTRYCQRTPEQIPLEEQS
jgi:histidinol-phosphatase (PHP family)